MCMLAQYNGGSSSLGRQYIVVAHFAGQITVGLYISKYGGARTCTGGNGSNAF